MPNVFRDLVVETLRQFDDGAISMNQARDAILFATTEWRPIEDAPDDGTVFLACTDQAQYPKTKLCWRDGDRWVTTGKPEKFVDPMPHKWWPTHWTPMPDTSALTGKDGNSEVQS